MARSSEFQLATSLSSKARTEDLDKQLLIYLNLLDEYHTCYQDLQSHLQSGFLNLAKAKVILGPRRVGPDSYDLSVRLARTTIEIERESWAEPPEDVEQLSARPALVLVHNQHDQAPPSEPEPDPAAAGGIRNRRPRASSDPASPPISPPPIPPPNHLPDPILQFAPLPPPPLRSAQHAFSHALHPILRLSNLRTLLLHFENQIHLLKLDFQNPPPS